MPFMAVMAGISAAAAVAGTVMSATRASAASGAGGASEALANYEKDFAYRSQRRAGAIQAQQAYTQAAELDVTKAGVQIQSAEQELARRRQLQQLTAANTIDTIARHEQYDPYSSSSAIERENVRLSEADIADLKLMEESQLHRLSFQQSQLNLAGRALDAGINVTPPRFDTSASDLAAAQRSSIWGEAGLKALGQVAGYAGTYGAKLFGDTPVSPEGLKFYQTSIQSGFPEFAPAAPTVT